MKILDKFKSILGLCGCKGCFKKAIVDIEVPAINHKGCLCDKHYDSLVLVIHEERKKCYKN